ncbi:hypothetical protein BDF21DRAFT_426066 [Thamnidium elegans]|nr:hypothetical protein BDF21DRAFT_426066 [Thamnidium elegans]
MNVETIEKLHNLVKHITETGEWVLDPTDLKEIKAYCKRSDVNVSTVFKFIMAQFQKKHAQIRYSSVQLIEQLFDRSKHFRDLITEDFPLFTQLAIGIQDKKLPPPVEIAAKLRAYAIALIKSWTKRYGDRYRQLHVAYDFLMSNGFLNNEDTSLSNIHANNHNRSSTDARKKAIQLNRYELLKSDIEAHIDIIEDNLNSMEGCFEILIPKNEFLHDDIDFDALMRGEASHSKKQDDLYKDQLLSHGLGSNRYSITINLSEDSIMEDIKETEENRVLFDQIREAYDVLETRHISQLNAWINSLMKLEIPDKSEKEKLVSRLINIKGRAAEEVRKAQMLGIKVSHHEPHTVNMAHSDAEDDDDEYEDEVFEEVNLVSSSSLRDKDVPTTSSSNLPPLQRIFPLSFEPNMIEDATYSGPKISFQESSVNKGKQKVDPRKEELLKRAPVVEWGDDLYYWDKTNVQFNTSGLEKSHRFMGTGEGNNEMPQHLLEELRKRPMYYKSEIQKNTQECRHPLHNGGLCPRKDLVTCPFHGRIIQRDELGVPLDPKERVEPSEPIQPEPPANNPMDGLWELIEGDVMNQSSREMINPRTRVQKKKKKEKSALINIRKKPNTSFTRLNKHLDSRKTRKMVEEAIEYEREMKSRNKNDNKL